MASKRSRALGGKQAISLARPNHKPLNYRCPQRSPIGGLVGAAMSHSLHMILAVNNIRSSQGGASDKQRHSIAACKLLLDLMCMRNTLRPATTRVKTDWSVIVRRHRHSRVKWGVPRHASDQPCWIAQCLELESISGMRAPMCTRANAVPK